MKNCPVVCIMCTFVVDVCEANAKLSRKGIVIGGLKDSYISNIVQLEHFPMQIMCSSGPPTFRFCNASCDSIAMILISPQVHDGVVAFQGRFHRDWAELLGLYLAKFAKRIQIWDKKLKWQTNQSNDRNQEFTQIKQIPKPICQSTLFLFIGCFKTDDQCITTLFQGEVKYLN